MAVYQFFWSFFSTFDHSGTCTKGENGANYIHLFCTNAYTYFSSVNNGTTPVIKPQISTFTHSVKNTEFYSHWKMVPFWRKILQNRWTTCFFRLVCFPSKNSFLICCFLLQAIIMVPPNRPKILGEWTLGVVQLPIHQAQMVRLHPMWTSPVLTPVRKANDVATVLM